MKRLSLIFFVAALLLAGVAIAAVVVRAGGLLPGQAVVGTSTPGSPSAVAAN